MKKQIISIMIAGFVIGITVRTSIDTTKLIGQSNELTKQIEQALIDISENEKQIEEFNTLIEAKIIEVEKRVQELEDKVNAEIERQKKMVEFTLTFYTTLDEENGWGPINCLGEPLAAGMVANNVLPLGTKIDLGEEYGIVEVRDRGGKNFDVSHRLDFLVMRNEGESDREYYERVNNYGIKKVMGYILEE